MTETSEKNLFCDRTCDSEYFSPEILIWHECVNVISALMFLIDLLFSTDKLFFPRLLLRYDPMMMSLQVYET